MADLLRIALLANWAVKISNISGLKKRQNGSRAAATAQTQESCRVVWLRDCYWKFHVITETFPHIWINLAVMMAANYFTLLCYIKSSATVFILLSLTPWFITWPFRGIVLTTTQGFQFFLLIGDFASVMMQSWRCVCLWVCGVCGQYHLYMSVHIYVCVFSLRLKFVLHDMKYKKIWKYHHSKIKIVLGFMSNCRKVGILKNKSLYFYFFILFKSF